MDWKNNHDVDPCSLVVYMGPNKQQKLYIKKISVPPKNDR